LFFSWRQCAWNFGKLPHTPGDADGCEKKELAGKAIRKVVKTKDRQRQMQMMATTANPKMGVRTDSIRCRKTVGDVPHTPGVLAKELAFA
jgi:hypothetical protein